MDDRHLHESMMCGRPQHLRVDRWYDDAALGAQMSYRPRHDIEAARKKANRRIEKWWRKDAHVNNYQAPSSHKLLLAKIQHFTLDGRAARISRSLASLGQPPQIHLTRDEWRQIMDDQDLGGYSL